MNLGKEGRQQFVKDFVVDLIATPLSRHADDFQVSYSRSGSIVNCPSVLVEVKTNARHLAFSGFKLLLWFAEVDLNQHDRLIRSLYLFDNGSSRLLLKDSFDFSIFDPSILGLEIVLWLKSAIQSNEEIVPCWDWAKEGF